MPLGDWQFWVVTAMAVIALWVVVRAVVPRKRKGRSRRVPLTVEKRKPSG